MIDSLDEEQYLTREVYAMYGLTSYYVQSVERGIGIIVTLASLKDRKIIQSQVTYEYVKIFEKTYGQIISLLQESDIALNPVFEKDLEKSLTLRNKLAHDFWWDNALRITNEEGKKAIIAELQIIKDFFEDFDNRLEEIVAIEQHKHGITEETINELLENHIRTNTIEQLPRVLEKIEKVVSIQKYHNNGNKTDYLPIFTFNDGSKWTLGDNGFIPAPVEVNNAELEEIRTLKVKFPFEINTHAKIETNWNYHMTINSGFILFVQSILLTDEVNFKWEIKKNA
jgi:hypothetical protein